jgi:beta-lactamase regulating signal transducer with metallopeptidase domain
MIQPTLMLVWTQAWQIAVLFFVILILFRLFARNRPRVAHLLWGVLLIKCLIPPVVSNSWAPFSWISHTAQQWLPIHAAESTETAASITYSTQRTDSLRSQPTAETPSITSANDSKKLTPSWQSYRSIAERTLFVFWIGSIAFVITVWASRFVHVLHRLHVHRIEPPVRVKKIVDDLAHLLKLRRQVQIQVSGERIGPAVVGWLRPRVLLPSFLVDRMDDEALRILIAHELTHIRRGDLFWAFLQTVAGSLWWFHPAVWIANRQLNIESERSCDEETIARLECSPSAYAKCLLQVLEWKHQLAVVPALPGVRPMQVTKDRLERIMKMRHGCYKQNSRGLWVAMVTAVILVAPGAEYGISQQSTTSPQEPPNAAKQPIELQQGGTAVSDFGVAGQVAVEQTPAAQKAIHETRVYEVSDLIQRIVADDSSNNEDAPKYLEHILTCYETPAIPPTAIATIAASPTPVPPQPASPLPRPASLKPDGEFSLLNGKFTATTSEANHQRIQTEMARYREFGFKYLHCSVEIFCGPDELSLEGLKWQNTALKSPNVWGIASLDRSQADSITMFVSQQNRIARLMAPRLMVANGSTGSAMVGTNIASMSSGRSQSVLVPDEDRFEGVRVDVSALIRPEDRIWIEFRFSRSYSEGEPIPPTMQKKQRTFFIDTAAELHKDEFVAFRIRAPELESPRKGMCYFALIHVEPVSMNGARQLPNAADANEKQNASQDSNTNKVIAIPRFDIE